MATNNNLKLNPSSGFTLLLSPIHVIMTFRNMRNYRWPEREQNKELPNQHKNTELAGLG